MDIKDLDLNKLKKEELIDLVQKLDKRLDTITSKYDALVAKTKGYVGYGSKKNPYVK